MLYKRGLALRWGCGGGMGVRGGEAGSASARRARLPCAMCREAAVSPRTNTASTPVDAAGVHLGYCMLQPLCVKIVVFVVSLHTMLAWVITKQRAGTAFSALDSRQCISVQP